MSLNGSHSPERHRINPERRQSGYKGIHPYFGKLDTALSRALIERFSKPGGLVLDPFCGSGAVLAEALLQKRSVVGWDSSPLATMIATCKLLGISDAEKKEIFEIKEDLCEYLGQNSLFRKPLPAERSFPEMPRIRDVQSWFSPFALDELGFLRAYVLGKANKVTQAAALLLKTAYSRIIIPASNQKGESKYCRVKKNDHPGRIVQLFVDSLNDVVTAASDFEEKIQLISSETHQRNVLIDNTRSHLERPGLFATIHLHDSRLGKKPSVAPKLADLVVTSPPYLMSWDYGLYHKFRFYWLGFDLDQYEETEIGRHLRRKKDDIERYQSDMTGVFNALRHALKKSATIAMVNAPSIVYGKQVDTNVVLEECANRAGWKLLDYYESIGIPGPHHGMYASLSTRGVTAPGNKGKCEHVLIFGRA